MGIAGAAAVGGDAVTIDLVADMNGPGTLRRASAAE